MSPSLQARYLGSLLGLACGDAVGTSAEFCPRGTFPPITDMAGGGPFALAPGQWTDDTSMALCLAESLLHCGVFDPRDQMTRYLAWWQEGYLSSTGQCFDIGRTVATALARFRETGEPFSGSTDPRSAGNGSLMRLAPIVLFYFPRVDEILHYSEQSSRTTHSAPEAVECCKLLAFILANALKGGAKPEVLNGASLALHEPKVADLARGFFIGKSRDEIFGTGYSVASLEAALWSFSTTSTFEAAVLAAANLGDDADTTAAIVGQLAGAYYGLEGIPHHWLRRLHMRDAVAAKANALYAKASGAPSNPRLGV